MSKIDNLGDKRHAGDFSVNPQNIGKGRKKKIYTILKEKGYSKDDIKTAFGEQAFYSMSELDELINNDTNPIIVRIVAKQFKQAFEKGDWVRIKDILEHSIGKPQQNLKIDEDQTMTVINGDPATFNKNIKN